MLKKLQKEIVKIRNKRAEIMNDARKALQRCDTCDRMMMWNEVSKCEDCRIRESDNNDNEDNKDIVNEVVDLSRENRENEVRSSRRQRGGKLKVKGGVTKKKYEGIKRVFSDLQWFWTEFK